MPQTLGVHPGLQRSQTGNAGDFPSYHLPGPPTARPPVNGARIAGPGHHLAHSPAYWKWPFATAAATWYIPVYAWHILGIYHVKTVT